MNEIDNEPTPDGLDLSPPAGYESWLVYAICTFDARFAVSHTMFYDTSIRAERTTRGMHKTLSPYPATWTGLLRETGARRKAAHTRAVNPHLKRSGPAGQ